MSHRVMVGRLVASLWALSLAAVAYPVPGALSLTCSHSRAWNWRSRMGRPSEPRDLYALYLQRGLNDRAKAFREQCRKKLTFDIDYDLKMVDESPDQYQRE